MKYGSKQHATTQKKLSGSQILDRPEALLNNPRQRNLCQTTRTSK